MKEYTKIRQFYAWVGFTGIITGVAFAAYYFIQTMI